MKKDTARFKRPVPQVIDKILGGHPVSYTTPSGDDSEFATHNVIIVSYKGNTGKNFVKTLPYFTSTDFIDNRLWKKHRTFKTK